MRLLHWAEFLGGAIAIDHERFVNGHSNLIAPLHWYRATLSRTRSKSQSVLIKA